MAGRPPGVLRVGHDLQRPDPLPMNEESAGFIKRIAAALGILAILGGAVLAATFAAQGAYGTAVAVQVVGILIAAGILALCRLLD